MTLALDIARCTGTTRPECAARLRLDRDWADGWMVTWLVQPPIDMLTGECQSAMYATTGTSAITARAPISIG